MQIWNVSATRPSLPFGSRLAGLAHHSQPRILEMMMANPINFLGANLVLKPPPGRDDVSDLYVMRNRGQVISCWQLEHSERIQIAETGRIFLSLMGQTMPPAFIATEDIMRSFTADLGILPRQKAR
jgi:hypothetical protein